MFSTSDIVNQVNQALRNEQVIIPNDKKIAVMTSANWVDGELDARAIVAVKLGNEWHVSNVLDWNHDQGISEGINLVWSK